MENLQQELIALKKEIRDLKTAQAIPSVLKTYRMGVNIPVGTYLGVYTWTVTFADQDTENTPIVYVPSWLTVLPFRDDNTVRIEWYTIGTTYHQTGRFSVYSSKPIYDIQPNF